MEQNILLLWTNLSYANRGQTDLEEREHSDLINILWHVADGIDFSTQASAVVKNHHYV